MTKKIEIGKIVSTQGIKGELRIKLESGFKANFEKFEYFYIDDIKYNIEKFRFKKDLLIIKLENINDINHAEEFINKTIYLYKEEIKLDDNEFLIQDLIGSDVYMYKKGLIGKLVKIDTNTSSTNLFVIFDENEGKEHLVPIINSFIKKIDFKNKKILLELVEGLIE